jgi:GNAT superfamily N-acetyltransferase
MPLVIRPMEEKDVETASRIFRVAFAKVIGLADPEHFAPTCEVIRSRRLMNPESCFVAEKDGTVVGSNVAARWGSVAFVGPLSIEPSLWDQGLGKRLMEPVMDLFDRWGVRHAGLFTFPQSPKHIGLYQKYGFWPGHLSGLLGKTLDTAQTAGNEPPRFSAVAEVERESCLNDLRRITDGYFAGLDLSDEILGVDRFRLGETVLVREGAKTTGFAVCHFGPGSEGGTLACYVKFGAVAPGDGAEERFARLLDGCETLARLRKIPNLSVGVSLARVEAFQKMRALGYRMEFQGVVMHRPNDPPYHRPGVFVVDDWR